MPYLEKLKALKEQSNLTCADIAKLSNVSLPTVTKVFNGSTPNPGIDTFIRIALALGASLDEIAGLKHPDAPPVAAPIAATLDSYAELLKEKDERIRELKDEKDKIRKEKRYLGIALVCVATFLVLILTIDILNGHFGYFRY